MRKRTKDIHQMIEAPLIGFSVVMLSLVCFLLLLYVLIVITRVVMG